MHISGHNLTYGLNSDPGGHSLFFEWTSSVYFRLKPIDYAALHSLLKGECHQNNSQLSPSTNITFTFSFSCCFFLCVLKKVSPTGSLLCLSLSEKAERLNPDTRPLICDWVWEMRELSVATHRELSARFSLPQRPTAGIRPQHEKHTHQWPPGAMTVDTDVERNSTDATHTFWI